VPACAIDARYLTWPGHTRILEAAPSPRAAALEASSLSTRLPDGPRASGPCSVLGIGALDRVAVAIDNLTITHGGVGVGAGGYTGSTVELTRTTVSDNDIGITGSMGSS
jgi:hypothetical protein